MRDPVRIALIGCGRIAQVAHLPALEKASGVELVAVSDPSRAVVDAVARRYDIPSASTDANDVFAAPGRRGGHRRRTRSLPLPARRAALEAGKHVLVEKPMAATVEEADALVRLTEETGLTLQVGRDEAARRRPPVGAQVRVGRPRRGAVVRRVVPHRRPPAGHRADALPAACSPTSMLRGHEAELKADRERYLLATHGAHVFDTVRYLLGDVAGITVRHRGDGRDHAWIALLTMASGAIGSVAISVDVPGVPSEGLEIFGARGALRVDTPFPFYRMASDVRAYANEQVVIPTLTDGDAYERQLEAFARAVRGELAPDPDARDGLAAVTLIRAAADAVASGSEIGL